MVDKMADLLAEHWVGKREKKMAERMEMLMVGKMAGYWAA